MSQYSLVIFDWDGTLMNSTVDITKAIQAACVDVGLPVPDDERASWVIGLSLDEALNHVVPDLTAEQRPQFLERYRVHFLSRDPELVLFPGVQEMLQVLHDEGVAMAVATGKSRVGLNRALENTGIGDFFLTTRCADETFGKPHPAMLHQIMDEIGTDPSTVVMVGDTSHDLLMAANAGVHGLGVSYGAHLESELRKHPHQDILHSVSHMDQWLNQRTCRWAPLET
ncbi:MAG: HAD-IA family hydrolase [Orrella sp.]